MRVCWQLYSLFPFLDTHLKQTKQLKQSESPYGPYKNACKAIKHKLWQLGIQTHTRVNFIKLTTLSSSSSLFTDDNGDEHEREHWLLFSSCELS